MTRRWRCRREDAVRVALRTQQIIAEETGVTNTIDPLGGSYFVESLTDRMEQLAYEYFAKIDELGGMIEAVKRGYPQREIADAAFQLQAEYDAGERKLVGVNSFTEGGEGEIEILRIDPALERKQIDRVQGVRARRDGAAVESALAALKAAAATTRRNLMPTSSTARACARQRARSSRRFRRSGAHTAKPPSSRACHVVAQATAGESRAAPKRGGHERRCHGLATVAVPRIDVTAGRSGSILLLCRFGPSWPHSAGRLGRLPRDAGALVTEPRLATLPARVVDARGVEYEAEGIHRGDPAVGGPVRRAADGRRLGSDPGVPDRSTVASRAFQRRRVAVRRHRSGGVRTFNAAVEAAGITPQPTPRRCAAARGDAAAPRTQDSASRLLSVAMEQAREDVRRRGPEQIADQLRAVSGARRAGDPDALRAELVRLAGRVLAWADALPEQAR